MKAAIYIRVSTLDQAREGFSLAAQRNTLEKHCADHDYDIYQVYEDAGISAKDIHHRPAMLRMLEDADHSRFDVILVWALSRFTRSAEDLFSTWNRLQRHNVTLKSHTEGFDATQPFGRAMMGMLGIIAQLEREITSERVKLAANERAHQGKCTCFTVLGYDYRDDTLTINEQEAEQVRYIFEKYKEYRNISAVAELCAIKGYHGKRGSILKAEHVKKILTRPVYIGRNSFNGQTFPGNFPPIISETQFNKTQYLLTQPTQYRR